MNNFDFVEDRASYQFISNGIRLAVVYHLEDATDILPMWVADMDFAAPKVLIDALQKRLEHPVFRLFF